MVKSQTDSSPYSSFCISDGYNGLVKGEECFAIFVLKLSVAIGMEERDGVLWKQWENISSKGNDVFGFHEVSIVFPDDFFYFFLIVWKQFEQRLLVAEMTQLAILQQKVFVVVSGFIHVLL